MGLLERLAAIPYSGALSDILDEMGLRNQVLPHAIRAVPPGCTLVGRALTVRGEPAEGISRDDYFIPFLRMLGSVQPGDVIISQPNDHTVAHFGELSAETAMFRGGRGAVIDGGVRDIDYIAKLGFPIFARYTTPQDIIGRWRLIESGAPITIGHTLIENGDYVVGDHDGVVVIPQSAAEETVTRAEACIQTENHVRTAILQGVHPVDAYQQYGRF
jgi:4-hydroxy-4-methyl-2-oxoglutarate aldolase